MVAKNLQKHIGEYFKQRGCELIRDNVKGGALTEVTFFILLSLYTPRHGYAIMQFIESETEGRLSLGAGTLYGALKTLLEKGWIEEASEIEERKKEYQITPKGKEIVEKELQRLYSLCEIAGKIMGGKQE